MSDSKTDKEELRCDVVSVWRNLSRQATYSCGHRGARVFRLRLYGRLSRLISGDKLCAECLLLQEMHIAINCGQCGKKILKGDPVSRQFRTEATLPDATFTEGGRVFVCRECSSIEGLTGRWTEYGADDGVYPLELTYVA